MVNMILTLKTDADEKALIYFNETITRLKNRDNLAKNPFIGTARFCMKPEDGENKLYTIIKMDSIFYLYARNLVLFFLGGVTLLSLIMGKIFLPWYVVSIGVMILLFNLLSMNSFYYFVVYGGLRKNNYKGPIHRISLKDFVEVAYFGGIE